METVEFSIAILHAGNLSTSIKKGHVNKTRVA